MRKMNVLSPSGRSHETRCVDISSSPIPGDIINTSNGESFRVVNVVHDERSKSSVLEVKRRYWVRGVGYEE